MVEEYTYKKHRVSGYLQHTIAQGKGYWVQGTLTNPKLTEGEKDVVCPSLPNFKRKYEL